MEYISVMYWFSQGLFPTFLHFVDRNYLILWEPVAFLPSGSPLSLETFTLNDFAGPWLLSLCMSFII